MMQVYVMIRHVGCIATSSSYKTCGLRQYPNNKIFLHYYEASMKSSFQRVNNQHLGKFVLPLMTDVSVILVVQVIRFIIVSSSQNCHKSRVAAALLSNIKMQQKSDYIPHKKILKAFSCQKDHQIR